MSKAWGCLCRKVVDIEEISVSFAILEHIMFNLNYALKSSLFMSYIVLIHLDTFNPIWIHQMAALSMTYIQRRFYIKTACEKKHIVPKNMVWKGGNLAFK